MLAETLLIIFSSEGNLDSLGLDSIPPVSMMRTDIFAHQGAISPGRSRLPESNVKNRDATNLDQVLYRLPSAQVATNSRGEATMSLRGGSERLTGILWEGTPLATPWDQRIDLSQLPSAMTGSVEVDQGASTILFGPWASGGAVNLRTPRKLEEGTDISMALQTGSLESKMGQIEVIGNSEGLSFASSAGTAAREGRPVPDLSKSKEPSLLTKNQSSSQSRTNTDRRTAWFASSLERSLLNEGTLGVSILAIDGTKGEAPSGFEGDKPRFWRYPDWRLIRTSIWGAGVSGSFDLEAAGWMARQDQTIEQYRTEEFSLKDAAEIGGDLVLGGRSAASSTTAAPLGNLKGTLSVQGQWTRHDQRTDAFDSMGVRRTGQNLSFEQWQSSAATELVWNPSLLRLTLAGAIEGTGTPESGDKPRYEDRFHPSYALTLEHSFSRSFRSWVSTGLRSRVPSLRELYGEALKKFSPNPNLRSERIQTMEWGGSIAMAGQKGQLVLFHRLEGDRIDQQTLPDKRIQRINLDDTRFLGVEGQANFVAGGWGLDASLFWLDASTDDKRFPQGKIPRVSSWITNLEIRSRPWKGIQPSLEWRYLGESWDHANNDLVMLPSANILNTRLAWNSPLWNKSAICLIYLRLDNILDTPHYTQKGLVGDGRSWSSGLELAL